jgi:hypothetical protein
VQQQSDAPAAAVPVHLLQRSWAERQDLETQEGLFSEDPDVCTQQHFQYSNTYSGGGGNSSYEEQEQEQFQEQDVQEDGPFLAGGNVLSAGQDPNFQPLSSLSDNDEVRVGDALTRWSYVGFCYVQAIAIGACVCSCQLHDVCVV